MEKEIKIEEEIKKIKKIQVKKEKNIRAPLNFHEEDDHAAQSKLSLMTISIKM